MLSRGSLRKSKLALQAQSGRYVADDRGCAVPKGRGTEARGHKECKCSPPPKGYRVCQKKYILRTVKLQAATLSASQTREGTTP